MQQFTEVFKALSDQTRRKIIQCLKEGNKTPSELLEEIDITQPTLSHHLDALKRANLIEGEREGQFIRYSLNMTVFDIAVEYLMEIKKGDKKI
ncbi:MAG TPA: autorepressor SdpR family transcription factor [Ignavibacteriaceae bacterium]|nr:autorepressor SdpR family transcription factor [Ignavibacteriaceae bacterium]